MPCVAGSIKAIQAATVSADPDISIQVLDHARCARARECRVVSGVVTVVDELVSAKLLDGQLDDTDLTMNDMARIRKSFVFTLTNMLHGRIAYPKDEDTDKQPAEDGQAEQDQDKEADTPPDEQSSENDKE